jgi:hypothetical protein
VSGQDIVVLSIICFIPLSFSAALLAAAMMSMNDDDLTNIQAAVGASGTVLFTVVGFLYATR